MAESIRSKQILVLTRVVDFIMGRHDKEIKTFSELERSLKKLHIYQGESNYTSLRGDCLPGNYFFPIPKGENYRGDTLLNEFLNWVFEQDSRLQINKLKSLDYCVHTRNRKRDKWLHITPLDDCVPWSIDLFFLKDNSYLISSI